MRKTSTFVYQIILVCGLLLFSFIIGLMVWGEINLPEERHYTDYHVYDFDDGWYRINGNGGREHIEIPGKFELTYYDELILEKDLQEIEGPVKYVSFDSEKQDVYAYIDGVLRYEYSTRDTRMFGSHSPGIWVFIPVYPKDEGHTLRIILKGDNNYSGVIHDIIIGTEAGIIAKLFESESITLLLTAMLTMLGIIAFVIGISVKLAYNKMLPLFFSGWAVMCAGLWAMAESTTRQLMAPNFSLISYITYLALIFLPFIMAMYFDQIQEGRYRTFYLIDAVLCMFVVFIGIILQFYNDTDLEGTLPFAFAGIILSMIIFVITVTCDAIQGYLKKYWLEMVGIIGVLIAGIIQMVDYSNRPASVDRVIILIGLIFMIAISYLRALFNVRNMERDMYAAVQAQEASSAFLTRMSHEMRTPINAILGMNKMILRESKEETILDYARDVNSAGNYLLGIVNEVLDLAKVNAGKIEIEPEEYDLIDMVRECYALVRPRAKASRLAFEVDMSDVLPSRLYGDKSRLIQVTTNLLTNAVKYTPEGRIKLSIQGKIFEGKLLLVITVSDTGIGVAQENIPYLFDSFRRVGEFNHKRIEGTGLGLTITKQLVELMDGNISVESELGKGTSFTVVVPQEIRSIEPCGTFSMGPNGDRRVEDRSEIFDVCGKILVVDDVAINLRVFTVLLKNTDIAVDTAYSGQEALEKIKRTKYDLIFIDHLMPGMDGLELKTLLDSIENNPNKDTPLIMQTANAVVGAKEEYERLGFTDYVEKPIKEEELRKILRKYII